MLKMTKHVWTLVTYDNNSSGRNYMKPRFKNRDALCPHAHPRLISGDRSKTQDNEDSLRKKDPASILCHKF